MQETFLGKEHKEHKDLMPIIKEGLVRLLDNEFPRWGLTEEDLVVVGEIGLGLAGIPLIGPHLSKPGRAPHLEAYIREEKYKGPRVEQARHPKKITLGIRETKRIQDEYGLEVLDFLIADPEILVAPMLWVDIGKGKRVKVLEPKAGIAFFADRTILSFTIREKGIEKIREWYYKLGLIEQVALSVGRVDVAEVCREKATLAREKWGEVLNNTVK